MKNLNKESPWNAVFVISLAITFAVVAWGWLAPANFEAASNGLFNVLIEDFGWLYMISLTIFVLFPVLLAMSKFGKVRLGPEDSRPEFSTLSWFAMLFSAGMGIGLVFYGVGEPIFHYMQPPFAEPQSAEAAAQAMRISFFHWGLHPWANYAVLALAMAYFQFRKNAPGLVSSVFLPLLGEKGVRGPIGKTIDILAIFATIAGVATSLGMGAQQINSGLEYLFNVPYSIRIQFFIILVIGIIYTGSAVTGIDKGIQFISNMNLRIAAFLVVAMFILGPTVNIIEALLLGIGDYASSVVRESFHMAPYGGDFKQWMGWWTLFYWAWWIAWAPFVGSFIARISRGRTIRQFVAGVLLVPAFGCFLWFAVFGTSALHLDLAQIAPEAAQKIIDNISTGLFEMFTHYPMGMVLSLVSVVLISTFFITSANSATFVLSMYSTRGNLNPPKMQMMVWGILQAALAFVLLQSGGLKSLQIASIAVAFPFSIVMLLACWSLWKALHQDIAELGELHK
jgi:glycine betaine transporter